MRRHKNVDDNPESVKARTDKAKLPDKVRAILEAKGVISAPKLPNPRMPKVDELIAAATKKGAGVTLEVPEPDPEAEPEDQVTTAVVHRPGLDSYEGQDAHAAVALAKALAEFLEATEPQQAEMEFGKAAD